MKPFIFIVLITALSLHSLAQQKDSVTGKWKLKAVAIAGLMFDLDKPAEARKNLEKQMEMETGEKQGADAVDKAYKEMMEGMTATIFEFTADGKAILHVKEDGQSITDIATYTVDYAKGVLITFHKEGAHVRKRTAQISFLNGQLRLRQRNEDDDGAIEEMILVRL